ncbi:MAG: lipoyl(octanoyl) transferase LipB [candidate division WOR-3 bacterium]
MYLNIVDLGICDFSSTLNKQKELWQHRIDDQIPDTLILVEHEPVFTVGKNGTIENLLISETLLKEKNIPIYRIERGGDITFHGPGQLVAYPIFKFKSNLIKVRNFIYSLEQIILNTLQRFGIFAQIRHPYIGVWIDDRKIASIGIAIKRYVSFHGLAINVTNDLSYFDLINPCGMKNIKVTSMEKELNKPINMKLVKEELIYQFTKQYNSIYSI